MSQELLDNSLRAGESNNNIDLLKEKNLEEALALFHEIIMSRRKENLHKIMARNI